MSVLAQGSAPADPLNFIPADVFYRSVPGFKNPGDILDVKSSNSTAKTHPLRYAAHVSLQDGTHCLVQFVTPQIWRIRFNPKFSKVDQYSDVNSRVIVMDKFSCLVDCLQQEIRESEAENSPNVPNEWFWKTSFEKKSPDHWVLSSVEYANGEAKGAPNTCLHFLASPFRIIATRVLQPMENPAGVVGADYLQQIIWETADPAFSYQGDPHVGVINNVVLNIKKPVLSRYLGFGYDNYNYNKVYDQGALDPKEPLYHSAPFFLEMNRNPNFQNVNATLVDNYSQVAIDLGQTDAKRIGVATRFNTFDAYVMAADSVPKLIWQYTSMVGRPKLKPRFILGHHQSCYGYTSSTEVQEVVANYRKFNIPLDGMHLDVDFQDRYRTFTISDKKFPDPGAFLKGLRTNGVKCCTNITPVLSLKESDTDQYHALRQFWDEKDKLNPKTNLLVCDKRYTDGLQGPPEYYAYSAIGYAYPVPLDPNDMTKRPRYMDSKTSQSYQDTYVLGPNPPGNYDSGYPYHGGVSYGSETEGGPNLGTPGYYPDLNRRPAREVWGKQYQYLFDNGLEFVWQDMTTPSVASFYGDMTGFPSRLLMTDDVPGEVQNPTALPKKTAIELWGLFSYNLHKATYHGLNRLKGRENKRNFIIGRGSLTGMHRFAGIWTGDNASSWNFWKIAVAQVLALGYSGLTIAGVDMGGFTADPANTYSAPRWCDPELLIRWYTGAFLLPWYRNHYIKHFQSKAFQEPWNYTLALSNEKYHMIPQDQRDLYSSVEPICRYYVQLRYSLMQVLYDCMFANLSNGLPIARAMLITDPHDETLFISNEGFIDSQYLLGHNILVAPITDPGVVARQVYFPGSDKWYPCNLRVQVQGQGSDPLKNATQLQAPVDGGSTISYRCPVPTDASTNAEQLPYVTPVYIRAGAIIPQLDVPSCQYIKENDLNPPVINIYPGNKHTEYCMYLDNGVSRDSAPSHLPQYKHCKDHHKDGSEEAKSMYRQVKITQDYQNKKANRVITLSHPWDGYNAKSTMGDTYYLGIWCLRTTTTTPTVIFQDDTGKTIQNSGLTSSYDDTRTVLTVSIPVALVPSLAGPTGTTVSSSKYIAVNITGLD
ncbi:hypothetical protein NM208_g6658 [Fusarium decemcellulare]|uniref:Uncharacterized protein n=1 Tax=Fusarium decemcellulare TaxID=57161 RepID=A0ACC1SC71_9HYPO|nr:hypothetical protein NM208_g6658 [Fusarium decemcellulare]